MSIPHLTTRNIKKLKAIRDLGGKCKECGETHPGKLIFHHIDKLTKVSSINNIISGNYGRSYFEIQKCELLCANCHRKEHSVGPSKRKNAFLTYKNQFNCNRCGYSKCTDALDFHHINRKNKIRRLALFRFDGECVTDIYQHVKTEIDKCEVICANCHLLEHSNFKDWEIFDKLVIEERIKKIKINKEEIDKEKAYDLYNKNFNFYEISKQLNCSFYTVKSILKELGINLNKIEKNKIKKLYQKGKTDLEISLIVGCNPRTVERYLKNTNIVVSDRRCKIDYEKATILKNKGLSNGKIAEELGCSKWSIQDYFCRLKKNSS